MIVTKSIDLRSNKDCLKHVEIAQNNKMVHKGIKGRAYLSKWINIPKSIYFDKMHMVD